MISRFFIARPVLSNVLALVFILIGLVALIQLPTSQYPNVVPPTVQVTTRYPGASARTLVDTVALPLEQNVNGVEHMLYMQSTSADDGTYTLVVTFAIGTDPDEDEILVQNQVASALSSLPQQVQAQGVTSLREIKTRIRPLFRQERVATNAGLFLEGLLGDEQRKTGWMRAEAAGDPGPWRQQAILGRRDWDADGLRDIVRDYVIEHWADDDAVLVIDETGFLKQGKASCGVARQYTGSAGKITNCQIGVFAAYVSRHGHAFIDRALYLPKEWTDDPDRLEAAYVPPGVGFATKPKLATSMIARAIAASVPFKWVAGDTVYGVGDIEQQLRQAGKGYVLGVSSAHVFQSWGKRRPVSGTAADIARTRRSSE